MSAAHYFCLFEEEKAMQFFKNNYDIAHLECKTKCEIGKGPKFTHLLVDYQIMWKLSEIFRKNLSKEAKIAYFLIYCEPKNERKFALALICFFHALSLALVPVKLTALPLALIPRERASFGEQLNSEF